MDNPSNNAATDDAAPSERLLVRKHARQLVDDPSNNAAIDDAVPSERSQIRKHARQPIHDTSNNALLLPPTPGELARLAKKARAIKPEATLAVEEPYVARNLRRRLAPSLIQELVDRYTAGEYTTDLSREYGISKSGLLNLLRDQGATLRKQPMTEEAIERAVHLYKSGLSIKEVMEHTGFSYGTVRRNLHEREVEMRPRGVKRSSL